MKYIFKPILISFVIVSGILLSCGGKKTDTNKTAFVMTDTMMKRSEFAVAEPKEVFSELKIFGKITADNNKSANVYSIMGGSVEKIYVELGDYVKQGELLATIKSSEVAGIQEQRLIAVSNVALAKKNLQVAKDLYEGKLNSEKDVIAAQKDLDVAEAELKRTNEMFSIYSIGGSSIYNVKAPISGYVIEKGISPNEIINGDQSSILFSVAEIKEVWAIGNVNESDISKVKVGYDADIKTLSYPDRIYKGKIDKVFSVIDPETKAMQVVVKIPNDDLSLKPQMSSTIHIHYSEDRKLIAVPSGAIIFDQNKNWVVVFRSKSDVEVRMVDVYSDINGFTYIRGGLKEGEKVISKNGLFIYDALTD